MTDQQASYYFSTVDWDKDIHLFTFRELNILLDVNSGSVHLLDDLTNQVLLALKKYRGNGQQVLTEVCRYYPSQEIIEILKELAELQKNGTLFTEDEPLEAGDPENLIKSLCLNIAHDCNLRCRYCFAGSGEFGGARVLMDFEVGKAGIDFLLKNSGARSACEVDFFGGEPLMNFQVLKELVLYGEEAAGRLGKQINFTVTTNGVLLNPEIEQFLNEHQVFAVLSLDGRKETHDLMRPTPQEKGSYDLIVPKFGRLVASRGHKNYVIRGTFTRHNLDFSKDVVHLADLGFTSLSLEPVVEPDQEDYAFRTEDLPVLEKEYDRLVEAYLARQEQEKPFGLFHFQVKLDGGPCVPKRLTGCGAGFQYLAVTPEGDLYPCHQFVGREAYRLGDVWQGIKNKELSKRFYQNNIYSKDDCKNCWARFYCSGGCHANAEAFSGNIARPYEMGCRLQKKRLECAIYLQIKNMLDSEHETANVYQSWSEA